MRHGWSHPQPGRLPRAFFVVFAMVLLMALRSSAVPATGRVGMSQTPARTNAALDTWSEVHATVEGRLRTTRFFKTWSGHRDPVTPRDPVDLIAAQALDVYYACSFEHIGGREVLVQFDKHRLNKSTIRALEVPLVLRSEPLLGFSGWVGSTPAGLHAMTPAGVLAATEYLVRTRGAATVGAIHVRQTLVASRAYRYSTTGRFQDFVDLVRPRN